MFVHRRDVVLVTANYRLGALGWMGGAAVARQNLDGSSGNFGLQDTRSAMQWVQRNIEAFGGDPKRGAWTMPMCGVVVLFGCLFVVFGGYFGFSRGLFGRGVRICWLH